MSFQIRLNKLNEQTDLKGRRSFILCLHVADPATLLPSHSVLGRAECLAAPEGAVWCQMNILQRRRQVGQLGSDFSSVLLIFLMAQ